MRDLATFQQAVREHRRAAGRTQQQLARAIGLHPDVLSHKLNGRDHAVLTTADVTGIVTMLSAWAAVRTRADAERLLELMDLPANVIPTAAWNAPPLSALTAVAHTPIPPAPIPPAPADETELRLRPAPAPTPPTPLIGRNTERAAIAAALQASRLVTLTGVGGTGKTRLAVQAAHDLAGEYADGVAFADLAAVREPKLLGLALARALGLAPPSTGAAEAMLTDALRTRELLLVADNLEQLLDETPLLGRLLLAAPGLRILLTSRIALRLYGETVLRVPPLGLPGADRPQSSGAVQLFVQRARAARAGFTADGDDLAAVARICVALDGLPLAIELAAAAVKLYPPQTALALLQDRLTMLVGGPRDLPHRQQTLRAALDWSYALLDPHGQQLFADLGVFAGPFDAAAAAAIHGGETGEMLGRLDALCDQSLVESAPGATPTFRLLDVVREYALARLAQTGRRDPVRRRHLEHYAAAALAARAAVLGHGQRAELDDLETAYPNIRAALDFAREQAGQDPGALDTGLRLAVALGPLWPRRLSLAEGAWQLDRLIDLDRQIHPAASAIRGHALIEQAALECFRGDYRHTTQLAQQASEVLREFDDQPALAQAHRFLGEAALAVGDDATAEPEFRRQLDHATRAGDPSAQAAAHNMLGQVARHGGRYREAETELHRALRLFGIAHDADAIASVLNSLGEVARDAGQPDRARRRFTAALRRHAQVGNARGTAYDLEGLAATAALHGNGTQALTYLGAAQTLRERTGGPLPPSEQAILDNILTPAVAALSPAERDAALARGRTRPIADTIARALQRPDEPASHD